MNKLTNHIIKMLDDKIADMPNQDVMELQSKPFGIRSRQLAVLIDLLVESGIIKIEDLK